MKILIVIAVLVTLLAAQTPPVVVADLSYTSLPFPIRTENSGIYAVAAFIIDDGILSLVTSDQRILFEIVNKTKLQRRSERVGENERSIESFNSVRRQLTDFRDGSYSDGAEIQWNIRVSGRDELILTSSSPRKEFRIQFLGDLAYAELIGIDASGNVFLLTERYRSEIPLRVQREVLVLNAEGVQQSVLEIPDIKYLSTEKDFRIDAEGNLYHMLTTAEGIRILQWPSLASPHPAPITYPVEYSYSLQGNERLPVNEATGDPLPEHPVAAASRTQALRIAESYAMHRYSCGTANLSSVNVTGPDGDIVRTPPWLVSGMNARIPYMWGGFSTLAQFDNGMMTGKYAGDINTAGVSSYSVGVDCSGFVSRCWQMTYHSSTSSMPSITTEYASWDSLKPGDAIHKVGHVRLFIERSANGGFRVVESAGRNWDVSYWTFAPSDLQGVYTPRSYNGMETNSSFARPVLNSVVTMPGKTAALSWSCDTAGVFGYRLYRSLDGSLWTLYKNESILGLIRSVQIPISAHAEYFRISSVKNDAARTESDWSNAMGASQTRGSTHFLIVDGFERLTASWENVSQTFSVRYGAAVEKAGATFSSSKNSAALIDTSALFAYDGIIWYVGDEGTVDETFSAREQTVLRKYLERGKALFVTGSEIGYDLSQNGSTLDKEFFSSYLKAAFKADNAGASVVKAANGFYSGSLFRIGQLYVEDYPDEIDSLNGSTVSLRYDNNKTAGVQYVGLFGSSTSPGKMIYLSFALETAGNDTALNDVVKYAVDYFVQKPLSVAAVRGIVPSEMLLEQNYPNPFNPSTTINYQLPMNGHVSLKIYDALGREVATLVNEVKNAGTYTARFNGTKLSSGIYLARLTSDNETQIRKLVLMK